MKSSRSLSIKIPLRDVIQDQSHIEQKAKINESIAFVAQPKQYALDSDIISKESKALHIDVYKHACESYTRLSAESASSSSKSDFHNLAKINGDLVSARNSVLLHELFFSNAFCRNSQISISSIAYARLARDFGDFNDWQRDFFSRASEMRCNGWVVTTFDTFLRKFVNITIHNDNTDAIIGSWPVIVLDCHEHSYVKDFNTNIVDYASKMMAELNWDVINDRIAKSDSLAQAIK